MKKDNNDPNSQQVTIKADGGIDTCAIRLQMIADENAYFQCEIKPVLEKASGKPFSLSDMKDEILQNPALSIKQLLQIMALLALGSSSGNIPAGCQMSAQFQQGLK